MNRRMLHLTTRKVGIATPKLTLRWPKLVLWAERLDDERQAGVSLVWRSRTVQPHLTLPVPWVEWRTVRRPRKVRGRRGSSLRARLWLLQTAVTLRLEAAKAKLVLPIGIKRFATNARGLASGVYESAVAGKLAPQIKVEYAQWQGWKLASVYGRAITFADVMLSLPIVAGVAVSFYYAWLAWLVQTNAIQLQEHNKIIMSSASAGKIIPIIVVWAFLRWYNKRPNSARERIFTNVAVLVLLGFFEAVSIGQAPA